MTGRWVAVVVVVFSSCKPESKQPGEPEFRATPLAAFPRWQLRESALPKSFSPEKPTRNLLEGEERRAWQLIRGKGKPYEPLADFESIDAFAWSRRIAGVQVVAFSTWQQLPTGVAEGLWLVVPSPDGGVAAVELLAEDVEDGEHDGYHDVVSFEGDGFVVRRENHERHRVVFDFDAELEARIKAKEARSHDLTNEATRTVRVSPRGLEFSSWRYANNDGSFRDAKTGDLLAIDDNGVWYHPKNARDWSRVLVDGEAQRQLRFEARLPQSPQQRSVFTFDDARTTVTLRSPDGAEHRFQRLE